MFLFHSYKPEMICRAWLPSSTGIPAKLREDRAGWVAMCSKEPSVTPVPSRLTVCRLGSSAKADTSLTWQNNIHQDKKMWEKKENDKHFYYEDKHEGIIRQMSLWKLKYLSLFDAEESQLWHTCGQHYQRGFRYCRLVQAELKEAGRSWLEI